MFENPEGGGTRPPWVFKHDAVDVFFKKYGDTQKHAKSIPMYDTFVMC